MDDHSKSKDELIRELEQLRSQLAIQDQSSAAPLQNNEQAIALTKAAESFLGVHDLPSLWPRIKTAVQNTLQPDRLAIFIYDQENDTLNCPYSFGLSQTYIDHTNHTPRATPDSEKTTMST